MAKAVYKIPADLDASHLDMEIAIQSKDGVGIKPLPIRIILSYVISAMLCFFVLFKTPISNASMLQKIIFVILWVIITFWLCKFDKTKIMQMQLIPVFFDYLPKPSRKVFTRKTSNATPFLGIVGISDIDDKTGMIYYTDGTFGYWYRVVGSASVLLFEDDKEAILSRVDSFYRKIGNDCECVFITTKEGQKVYRQVASLKRRYDKLTSDDPDLLKVADEQLHILTDFVGGTFKSIHQYLVIKADNKEALLSNKNVLQSEVENSSLMIKQCIPMYKEDVYDILKDIYAS